MRRAGTAAERSSSSDAPTTKKHKGNYNKAAPKHPPCKARGSRERRRLQAERMDDLQAVLRYNVALQARAHPAHMFSHDVC